MEGHWSHVSIFLLTEVITRRKIILDMQFPNQPLGGKMEGCESCPLSNTIDGHRSHVSTFLLTKVITRRRLILDLQFHNQPLGVKWKVVKVVHCPTLLMDTVLTSLPSC